MNCSEITKIEITTKDWTVKTFYDCTKIKEWINLYFLENTNKRSLEKEGNFLINKKTFILWFTLLIILFFYTVVNGNNRDGLDKSWKIGTPFVEEMIPRASIYRDWKQSNYIDRCSEHESECSELINIIDDFILNN